jgi:tight adherence protein B
MDTLGILAPLVVFAAVVFAVLAVVQQIGAGQREVQARLASYDKGAVRPSGPVNPTGTILKRREFSTIPALQTILNGSNYAERIAADLAEAGLPLRAGEYLMIRWLCAVVLAVPPMVVGFPWFFGIPLAIVGFLLPGFYLQRRKQQRLQKFNDNLVDALSMMANALKSGSSFLQAVDLISRELPPPVSEEFGRVVAEVSVGRSVDDALLELTNRVKSYDLYLTVTAMLVQRQTGGNLSEILDKISYTIRERIRLLRQVQVLTAQERMSSIVVGLMPVAMIGVISLVAPGYYGGFIANPIGKIMFGGAFASELCGFVVMNRISKIDV